ncbi:Folate-biopterin transporter, partial [Globisporangium splendens]
MESDPPRKAAAHVAFCASPSTKFDHPTEQQTRLSTGLPSVYRLSWACLDADTLMRLHVCLPHSEPVDWTGAADCLCFLSFSNFPSKQPIKPRLTKKQHNNNKEDYLEMSAAKVNLIERISYTSSNADKVNPEDGGYTGVKSPHVLENGALREGGAPHLLSKESLGLLAQYAAVGLVYGTLPATVTPFLTYYLNLEGQSTTSARALLSIPWSLKVFVGMISDNFPIFGYRRRPYMMFGWTMCAICLFVMACTPLGAPYFGEASDRKVKPDDYEAAGVYDRMNTSARSVGGKYIVLMTLASLGYVISDVAADAVVVEYAQREPIEIRGRTQTAIYTVRTFFSIFAQIILGIGLNKPAYGGDFDFGISFPNAMLILAIFCIPVIPMTWFFIAEPKYYDTNFKQYIFTLWEAMKTRAFYQVIAYSFFSGVLASVSYVSYDPITSYWVEATNFNLSLSGIFGNLVMVVTLIWTGKSGLHWNWRTMIAITMVAVIAMDMVCTMLVTWDVVRNQWFWLGVPIVENVPTSVSFIVSTYVVVELAGEGNEGACYGLFTTVMNLSSPFALTITKNLDASFDVYNNDIISDTDHVHSHVTYTLLIMYALKLLSLSLLPLLPAQKEQTQALKRTGGSSALMGGLTIFYCMFALVWSIMVNIFAIYESTACLKITGGCKE